MEIDAYTKLELNAKWNKNYFNYETQRVRNCNGFIIPYINLTKKSLPDPVWKCSKCETIHLKNKIHDILYKIANDYSLTDKQDINSCEKFLKHYDKNNLLHPNHYFLVDIRLKLAQLFGQTIDATIQNLSDENLQKKTCLCQQSLEFATTLFPAEWRLHGLLEFELHASIAESARRKANTNDINFDSLKLKIIESKIWLEKAIFHLKYEPEILPEGKILKQAKKNLEDVTHLLTRMDFQT